MTRLLRQILYSSVLVLIVLIFGAIGWFAGHVGRWLTRRPAVGAWMDRVAGGVFVALGARLILSR